MQLKFREFKSSNAFKDFVRAIEKAAHMSNATVADIALYNALQSVKDNVADVMSCPSGKPSIYFAFAASPANAASVVKRLKQLGMNPSDFDITPPPERYIDENDVALNFYCQWNIFDVGQVKQFVNNATVTLTQKISTAENLRADANKKDSISTFELLDFISAVSKFFPDKNILLPLRHIVRGLGVLNQSPCQICAGYDGGIDITELENFGVHSKNLKKLETKNKWSDIQSTWYEWSYTDADKQIFFDRLFQYLNEICKEMKDTHMQEDFFTQYRREHNLPPAESTESNVKPAAESDIKPTESKFTSFSDFFRNEYDAAIANFTKYKDRATGFSNLDEVQAFLPGIYVIGGTPSTGKSTFCWQLLNQLSERGEHCLYCSYEMSKLELFCKSVTKRLYELDSNSTLTAADIKRGAYSPALHAVIDEFKSDANNRLNVLECSTEPIDDILAIVREHYCDKGITPTVCLDYLQIIPPSKNIGDGGSDKSRIDDIVRKIKTFQQETNATFIVISSFNRAAYVKSEISFDVFKESGGVEYTADVALGIANVDKETGKIVLDKIPKRQQPRTIRLFCLKNRHGDIYQCDFEYYSAHDYFKPANFDTDAAERKSAVRKKVIPIRQYEEGDYLDED